MSVESISIALHHSRATGAAKLVLIGIANHDGDGGAWPSVATLAKYAGVTVRNVQKAVERLEQLHEIRRFVQAGGDHRTAEHERPNRYQFLLTCPPDCDRTSRHRTRTHAPVELSLDPLSVATPGVGSDTRPPVGSDTQTTHVTTPQVTKKERRASNRARGACGHELIDDRHCERGCPVARVEGAPA
ncbi:helix-turn-helix domain-containing protein [Microbacterium sp. XT11]|uniref:helix-turn-helix domain-containing protein n=1 Tax=Microbacterium sp. XT11 TaxID=367477 RepID=UPI000836CA02|nr:helix-turn-helix domain-containing protein [Microbacterium sp. XT11]